MTHFHYLFVFYDMKTEQGQFVGAVNIDVRAESIDEAIKRAKEIASHPALKKEFFNLVSIIEHDHADGEEEK